MRFVKYQGLGNDFIVVDARAGRVQPGTFTPVRVRALCDRRFGVGADGVLLVCGPRSPGAVAEMRVHNADGSTAEMCGNGLRCVARALAAEAGPDGALRIDTGAGPLTAWLRGADVEIAMGPARDDGALTVEVEGRRWTGRRVSMGNPHFVLAAGTPPEDFERVGPALQVHPAFAGGVNVSHVERAGLGALRVRVWERGCGPTLACGTGACAAVAAGWLAGDLEAGEVAVDLPGGRLWIGGGLAGLTMRGPAVEVFRGETAL